MSVAEKIQEPQQGFHLVLPGVPTAKARARFDSRNRRTFTPKKVETAEAVVRWAAMQEMHGTAPIEGPIEVSITAIMPIPASWSQRRKDVAGGGAPHTNRPDADNLVKLVLDGLNKIAFGDDAQVWRLTVEKRYGAAPRFEVSVTPTEAAPPPGEREERDTRLGRALVLIRAGCNAVEAAAAVSATPEQVRRAAAKFGGVRALKAEAAL